MKSCIPAILLTSLLLAGCGPGVTSPAPKPKPAQTEPEKRKGGDFTSPKVGMTKEEVRAQFGKPSRVATFPDHEVWSYVANRWDAMNFVPGYGAYNSVKNQQNTGNITFGADGKVTATKWGYFH